MSEWQPIETAPENIPILVLNKAGDISIAEGKYSCRHKEYYCMAEGAYVWDGDGDRASIIEVYEPTHWMPLPEPPKEE